MVKKISSNKFKKIVDFFNYLNLIIYKLMPKADLAIFLDVELQIILKRNANKIKPEPNNFVKKRYEQTKELNLKAKKIINYKNHKNLNEATNDCLKIISKFISK